MTRSDGDDKGLPEMTRVDGDHYRSLGTTNMTRDD